MSAQSLCAALLLTLAACGTYAASWDSLGWDVRRTDRAGCSAMCCSGRNSSCYSNGPRMGGVVSANGRCFCDEGCLDMDDCCEDYSLQCQAVDCVVGEWKEYSECSRACGLGSKTRERDILQQPRNGGAKCPALKESTVCKGDRCKVQRHIGRAGRSDDQTAKIMPAHYGQYRDYRQYNAHLDIRKNLFYKYYASLKNVEQRGYCAYFKITSDRQACSSARVPWAAVLERGQTVCVECQTKAMGGGNTCLGHGSVDKDSFWTAVNARGCHGWWRRTTELRECSCGGDRGLDFIFI